jgi:membrane protease YdiL (CAAX protease family)
MQPDEPDVSAVTMPAPEAVPERQPFWSYADLALLTGLLAASIALVLLLTAIAALVIPALHNDITPILLPMQLLLYVFIYLCLFLLFKFRYNRPVFASLGWRRAGPHPLLLVAFGVALAIVESVVAEAIHTPKVDTPIEQFTRTPVMLALFAITAITVGPLFEEMIFRGFLQPLFSRTFGVVAGVLLTAAIFGALHGPEYSWAWQYALAVTVAGAVFGWVRARTQSIIPATILHGSYNAVSVVALIYMKYGPHK